MTQKHTTGYPDHRKYGCGRNTDIKKGGRRESYLFTQDDDLIIAAQSGAGIDFYKVPRKKVKKVEKQKEFDKYLKKF